MIEINLLLVFFIGIVGGVYCVGMCGGIVVVFCLVMFSYKFVFFFIFVYNFGCIVSYILVGVIIGVMG